MLASAVVAETATITPAVPKYLPPHPNQKYIDALRYFDELIAANVAFDQLPGKHPKAKLTNEGGEDLYTDLHTKMDVLFHHILSTFQPPTRDDFETRKVARIILREYSIGETELRKIPPTVMETAWPLAMVKIILRDHAMPINHRRLKTFGRFHDRYGFLILED